MADKKISELQNITGANLADGDELVVVDASESETKAITFGEFKTALDTSTGFVRITGDTMTGALILNADPSVALGAATKQYVDTEITGLVDSAPAALDTLNELAAALGDDANFSTTVTNSIAAKVSKSGDTMTGNLDVQGTVTSDGLTVENTSDPSVLFHNPSGGDVTQILRRFNASDAYTDWVIKNSSGEYSLTSDDTVTSNAKRFSINYNGDISFYEDTGTTAKFFWDASAESLGIGGASPAGTAFAVTNAGAEGLEIRPTGGLLGGTSITAYNRSGSAYIPQTYNASQHIFVNSGSSNEKMRIDSSGNVGIGTSSPEGQLHLYSSSVGAPAADADDFVIEKTGDTGLSILSTTTGRIYFGDAASNDQGSIRYVHTDNSMRFETDSAERMRIDSSGNLLVGKTSSLTSNTRAEFANTDTSTSISSGAGSAISIQNLSTTNNTYSSIYFTNGGGGVDSAIYGLHEVGNGTGTGRTGSLVFATANLGGGAAEAMRIESNGRMAIGKTSATAMLDIDSTTLTAIQVSASQGYSLFNGSSVGAGARISVTAADASTGVSIIGYNDAQTNYTPLNYLADHHKFKIGSSEKVRITDSGNLFIGTTSSLFSGNHMLEMYTSNAAGDSGIVIKHRDATGVTNVNAQLFINNAGSAVGSIKMNSSSTTYNTSSDYRLKENITDVTDGITRVKQLAPKRFNFIANPDAIVDGFLAHEAQTVVPEAVTGTQDAMRDEPYEITAALGEIYSIAMPATYDDDGNELTAATDEVIHSTDVAEPETLADGQFWRETTAAVMGTRSVPDYQGIDQSKLVPLLTAALQEAIAKIETLETEMTSVKARLDALEA